MTDIVLFLAHIGAIDAGGLSLLLHAALVAPSGLWGTGHLVNIIFKRGFFNLTRSREAAEAGSDVVLCMQVQLRLPSRGRQ